MNFYPSELITPPLALVALLGCPELHPEIGEFLRSQHKPPINSLGVADPWAAARLFGERKSTLTAPADQTGILKVHSSTAIALMYSLFRTALQDSMAGIDRRCLRFSTENMCIAGKLVCQAPAKTPCSCSAVPGTVSLQTRKQLSS